MPFKLKNDNTRVLKPLIVTPIKRKLVRRTKNEEVRQDNRSLIIRLQAQSRSDALYKLDRMLKALNFTILAMLSPFIMADPSHLVGVATSNKPFIETIGNPRVQATSNEVANFLLGMASPGDALKLAMVPFTANKILLKLAKGELKTVEDLRKVGATLQHAKELLKAWNAHYRDYNVINAILKKIETGGFGKKGSNDIINKELLKNATPRLIVNNLLNKYIPILELNLDDIRTLVSKLYPNAEGKTNYIDWIHDNSAGFDFLGRKVEDPRFDGNKYIIVNGKQVALDERPFLERYYNNVMKIIAPGGLLELLIRSGELSVNKNGQWIAKINGEPLIVDPKLYIISKLENFKKTGNRYTSKQLRPVHGTKLNSSLLSKQFASPSNKNLFAVDAKLQLDGEIKDAENKMLDVYSGQNGSLIPFYYKAKQHEGEVMSVPENAPAGYHESNHYNGGSSLKDHFESNGGRAQEVKRVVDPTNKGGAINEYDFGKGTPDIKSMWNTLDFEPGAGPFAHIILNNTYLDNLYG